MSSIIGLIVILFVYFLPTVIAVGRDHQPREVFAVNFALGWTGIGWFAALIYAFKSERDPAQKVVHHYTEPTP